MDRSQVGELFYIAPVANVEAILKDGILSHNRAARTAHSSVALQVIQEIRERVRVSATRMLHDHANLYICGRNPMMYYVTRHNALSDVCLLRVSPSVLDLPNVAVADGNASSTYTSRFDAAAAGLARIDYARVHAERWTHPDEQIEEWEHKRVKCAEVLVPDLVEPVHVIGAYAPTPTVLARLQPLMAGRDVRMARYPFFAGPE